MDLSFLEFEQPIAELEAKIEELRLVGDDAEINIQDEIGRLEQKSQSLTAAVFSSLTPWQISQLARHPQRPYMLDYVNGFSMISMNFMATAPLRMILPSWVAWRGSRVNP